MNMNKESLTDLWDIITHTKICIIEVPEEDARGEASKDIWGAGVGNSDQILSNIISKY